MNNPEKKALYRVMEVHNFDDAVYYRIACDCGEKRHDLEVTVEFDKHGILWLFLDGKHTVADWWNWPKWYCRVWKRIKLTLSLLFLGQFEAHGEFLLLQEEHINSIIDFLNQIKNKKAAQE